MFHSIYLIFFPPKAKFAKILLIGLDNSGKSSLLRTLKAGKFEKADETEKCEFCQINLFNYNLTFIDTIGKKKFRDDWEKFYTDCNGIVFMIDASCHERFKEAEYEFERLLNNKTLPNNTPILILANKVDVAGALTYSEVVSLFKIDYLYSKDEFTINNGKRPIHIAMTSIKQFFGFNIGLKWLTRFF